MQHTPFDLRADALRIWQAGLAAVRSERLMQGSVRLDGTNLLLGKLGAEENRIDLSQVRRIAVVGAGKAGAGMAAALEEILGAALMREKQLTGWINVPADCVRPLQRIHLHASRPAGKNEPTAEGVAGAEEILRMVGELGPEDLGIALISGGGSALLPLPIEGVSLADKLTVTKFLSSAGADIVELNTVRKQLSRIKGGGLARACNAGKLVSLIISDVLGDRLDLIASGPTADDSSSPSEALSILRRYHSSESDIPIKVCDVLEQRKQEIAGRLWPNARVLNRIIGNNETAVNAAADEAKRLGYDAYPLSADGPEGAAETMGRALAMYAVLPQETDWPKGLCYVSGGECTVKLAPEAARGLGGRNQQTVLAAFIELQKRDAERCVILSGGTDGEDGPTDAAGALVDRPIIADAARRELDAADYLRRNDAYHFFAPLGALIKTGPTHTNVCDVRVVLVEPS
ncbi:MAG: DUF4147 domain-containing protein [Pirellulales bacterium]|nr:DUF4147 domain-containing protein [Pirellulales bacterium]